MLQYKHWRQRLFIYDDFEKNIDPEVDGKSLTRWTTRWTAIQGARNYFYKITEELIDPNELLGTTDSFVRTIGGAYQAYEETLYEKNCVDLNINFEFKR